MLMLMMVNQFRSTCCVHPRSHVYRLSSEPKPPVLRVPPLEKGSQ